MQPCCFWCGYKTQIQIFNCQISPGLTQPVNRVASTTVIYFAKLETGSTEIILSGKINETMPE